MAHEPPLSEPRDVGHLPQLGVGEGVRFAPCPVLRPSPAADSHGVPTPLTRAEILEHDALNVAALHLVDRLSLVTFRHFVLSFSERGSPDLSRSANVLCRTGAA